MRVRKPTHSVSICDDGIALDEPAAAAAAATLPRVDDWSVRQSVRQLGRELRRPGIATAMPPIRFPEGPRRFDPPQNVFAELEQATTPSFTPIVSQPPIRSASRLRRAGASQIIAWLVVFAGILVLVAGVSLVGWSLATRQMHLWNIAVGLTLGGQGTLILGLVLVVSRLWRNSRHATNRLQDVHARLGQLQHTADVLTAMRSGGAPTFYADLVRGASPQVLLTNLKGQLDQLATRIGSW
jgi:hypothetical protein